MSPEPIKHATGRRTVCDHCRRRRIRCDGEFPCNQCNSASLSCKREHVPKRRGPKRGSGRVINELRAHGGDRVPGGAKAPPLSHGSTSGSHTSGPPSIDQWISDSAAASAQFAWHPIMSDIHRHEELNSTLTTDQLRPTSPSYFHLIPICLDLFMVHIYPIMCVVHMPTVRGYLNRPIEMDEKNLLYSLCALTSTHMSGKNTLAPGPPSWDAAGRFFLDECISVRQKYDFIEDKSLSAVISSYFIHTAFFELNQNRKSWYYLREALTLAQDMNLQDETSYVGLTPAEALCRRRTFWVLYVTERSYAILRHKPLTLSKTPEFPTTLHDYELPEIHDGFMRLVNSYHLLDSPFVDTWNESTGARASTLTYTALQRQLNRPQPADVPLTDIQKADILITQQWLRLIVWQSSMRQGLLSSNAEDESMTFRYPLKIAHSLLDVISSLPTTSIEVHGMGIFEKIFEIGNTMLDVIQACGTSLPSESYGVSRDPFEVFVKTLSQTPNSQRHYATLLLAKAAEKPEFQRLTQTLTPTLTDHTLAPQPLDFIGFPPQANGSFAPPAQRRWRGSIVGEIGDDGMYKEIEDALEEQQALWADNAIWIPETVSSSDDGMTVL